ncbi:MAG: hypothetical protein V9E87_12525 [Gemmatimonadales bacterium]
MRGADHGEVVGLGPARGEDHLVRFDAERFSDFALPHFESGLGGPPEAV